MGNYKQNILLFLLITFSVYCAISIGKSWDEGAELIKGKITLDYLFSLGEINNKNYYREYYSTVYLSSLYLLTKIFPTQYQIEASHLVNLFFSLSIIFAIGKFSKEMFNKNIGKIAFLVLFFYPLFFGHMAMNNKDLILALAHVWIFYLILRYLKLQSIQKKRNKYIIFIGVLAAAATGVQLVFLGSIIPILFFLFFEIFFIKQIIKKSFSLKKILIDIIKCFIIFYIVLIVFWVDTYSNIFTLPFSFFIKTLSTNFITGWPYNLIDGVYYLSHEVPKSYIFINLFYKSPEYFLITYLMFIIILFIPKNFFHKEISNFNHKIFFLFIILLFPSAVLYIVPYPIYDGMRLFLWCIPYFSIIPALTIYFLYKRFNFIISKICSLILFLFAVYFLFNFISITPYHYVYLNSFNGKATNAKARFENDYWATSTKELINKTMFEKNQPLLLATCGVNRNIVEYYFIKNGYTNIKFTDESDANYIIMTNRTIIDNDNKNITNCFDKFEGNDLFKVDRNGMTLSVIRKIKI